MVDVTSGAEVSTAAPSGNDVHPEEPSEAPPAVDASTLQIIEETSRTGTDRPPPSELDEAFLGQVEGLIEYVRHNVRPGLPKDVQEKLAEVLHILVLLPHLDDDADREALLSQLRLAVKCLLLDPPNVQLAEGLKVSATGLLPEIVRSPYQGKGVALAAGLAVFIYVAIPLALLAVTLGWFSDFAVAVPILAVSAAAGALGSVASLLTRIDEFDRSSARRSVIVMTAISKPVVGALFSMFAFSVLRAGLIPVTIAPTQLGWFQLALGFAAGFSERLAPDLASGIEANLPATRVLDQAPNEQRTYTKRRLDGRRLRPSRRTRERDV